MKKIWSVLIIGLLLIGATVLTTRHVINGQQATVSSQKKSDDSSMVTRIKWQDHYYSSNFTLAQIRQKFQYPYRLTKRPAGYQNKFLGITSGVRAGYYTKNPSKRAAVHYQKYSGHFALFETYQGGARHYWHYVNLKTGQQYAYHYDEFFGQE